MADEVKFTLSAEEKSNGSISGKGTVSFKINLTELRFNIDYKDEDHLVINLSASQGLKISTKGNLTFSGSLNHCLFNRTWDGSISIKMDIKKSISAALTHSFSPKKRSIRIDLKINL